VGEVAFGAREPAVLLRLGEARFTIFTDDNDGAGERLDVRAAAPFSSAWRRMSAMLSA
jgi:hypothetical protein